MRRARSRAAGRAVALGAAALVTLLTAAPPALAAPAVPPGCLPPPTVTEPAMPWAQRQLAPQRVWPVTRGAGVVVAVVDTGVDARTPQLTGANVLPGADVVSDGPADSDCYGHGTFVGGIIAAQPVAGSGFAGIAPDATLLPIRVTVPDADGDAGRVTAASLSAGIRRAVDEGARVINVSASTSIPDAGLAEAVAYAAFRDVVVVASAANGARTGDPVTYPASYPTVIAVGAVDAEGGRADFSQTGPYLSLVGPGSDVVSIGPGGPGHWQGSGTSYAAPFVAGTAALVRAYRPDLRADQVKHRLEATATHPAVPLPDPALGWGTVNPVDAVTAVLPEEGTGREAAVVAPPVRAPEPVTPSWGPLTAVLSVLAAAGAAAVVVLLVRLGPAGHRRGWSPPRRVEIRGPTPAEGAAAQDGRVPERPSGIRAG